MTLKVVGEDGGETLQEEEEKVNAMARAEMKRLFHPRASAMIEPTGPL